MILWLSTVVSVFLIMMVFSSFMHHRHHNINRNSLCRCGHNCMGDFCECEYYRTFYCWATRVVIGISIFSPLFLEYKASVFSDSVRNYIVVNEEYKEINSVVWDLPWGPRIVTVSAGANEYRDSRIIFMKGDELYVLIPVFTWKYSSDPAVYDNTEKLSQAGAEKLFTKFILRNESKIRSLMSTMDIKGQQEKKRFENKLRELITSDIQIPGIEFGLEYCAIYEK